MNNVLIFILLFCVVLFVFRTGYYFGSKDYEEYILDELEDMKHYVEEQMEKHCDQQEKHGS